jgi:putative flippase GtrA
MRKRMLPDRETQVRFIRFFVVGGTAYVVQNAAAWALAGRVGADSVFGISYVLSVATHYTLNRFWALRSDRGDTVRQFLHYLVTVGVGLLINFTSFRILLSLGLGVRGSIALAVPPSTVAVFFLLNYWVFRNSGTTRRSV